MVVVDFGELAMIAFNVLEQKQGVFNVGLKRTAQPGTACVTRSWQGRREQ